tara:strand:- start:28 stop:774 length:747 start_codon:yes stop_codon:yes gene_type:complete
MSVKNPFLGLGFESTFRSFLKTGVIKNGLVMYLDAGDSRSYSGSGTTWTDLSGRGNNATLVNTPTFSSNNKGYFDFNGSNEAAAIADSDDFTFGAADNDFTLDFWGYMDALPGSGSEYGMMTQRGFSSDNAVSIDWKNDGGTMRVNFGFGGAGSLTPVATLPAEQWIYCACGRRSGVFFVNINGTDIATFANSNTINDSTNTFYIGRNFFSSRYLNGRIALARVYNHRSLSKTEVKQNYDSQKGRFNL